MGAATETSGDVHTVPFLIGGKEVHPQKSFAVVSPATGKVVHRCGAASEVEVKAAVDAATAGFKTWKNTTLKARRDILFKAAAIMERRKEELAGYMVAETGGAQQWAEFNLKIAQDLIVDVAGRVATIEGSFPATEDAGVGALVLREPYGVVLAIAPW
jgi:acyl-CoA reductase-like NAD-dependent aldehyde dehydrogenase